MEDGRAIETGASEDTSLPAWIYSDPEFLEAEADRIFRRSWQIVCHVSDAPERGDYCTLELIGESLMVLRDATGTLRGFHNVCRHRAARLLDGTGGNCRSRITCPYHGWTYALDGRLAGVPQREAFPHLNPDAHGLFPVELEIYRGFVFLRILPGGPSVAEMMAPFDAEFALYRTESVQPLGRLTRRERAVNWKNVGDNYSDALHIRVAHPGLTRLFGEGYGVENRGYVDKMWGALLAAPSANAAERAYHRYLPTVEHLPPERRRLWCYFKLWPNMAFDLYPDQIDFMHWIPLSPTRTLIREIAYALPDDRREMRACRYLNWRINRRVSLEDRDLIERVQQGMASSRYTVGPLGAGEVSLRAFGRRLRETIPAAAALRAPAPGWSQRA